MDDELDISIKLKGTKYIFSSHAPKRAELDMCQDSDMTSHKKWNPESVNILDTKKNFNDLK